MGFAVVLIRNDGTESIGPSRLYDDKNTHMMKKKTDGIFDIAEKERGRTKRAGRPCMYKSRLATAHLLRRRAKLISG